MTIDSTAEWLVYVGGHDCIALAFNVINADGIRSFATAMSCDDAQLLAEALLRQVARA